MPMNSIYMSPGGCNYAGYVDSQVFQVPDQAFQPPGQAFQPPGDDHSIVEELAEKYLMPIQVLMSIPTHHGWRILRTTLGLM